MCPSISSIVYSMCVYCKCKSNVIVVVVVVSFFNEWYWWRYGDRTQWFKPSLSEYGRGGKRKREWKHLYSHLMYSNEFNNKMYWVNVRACVYECVSTMTTLIIHTHTHNTHSETRTYTSMIIVIASSCHIDVTFHSISFLLFLLLEVHKWGLNQNEENKKVWF